MELLDVFREVRTLITDPRNWTKYSDATDRHGNSVDPVSSEAEKWSLNGAFKKVKSRVECIYRRGEIRYQFQDLMLKEIACDNPMNRIRFFRYGYNPEENLRSFNNQSAHKRILRVLDKAIRRMER